MQCFFHVIILLNVAVLWSLQTLFFFFNLFLDLLLLLDILFLLGDSIPVSSCRCAFPAYNQSIVPNMASTFHLTSNCSIPNQLIPFDFDALKMHSESIAFSPIIPLFRNKIPIFTRHLDIVQCNDLKAIVGHSLHSTFQPSSAQKFSGLGEEYGE
jgi:hypothetical protein